MFNPKQTSSNSDSPNCSRFNNSLKILQWNCQGLRSKLPSLQFHAQDYDLICIQESLLQETNKLFLKGFHIVRKDISDPGLRSVCMCIKHNIPYSIVDLGHISHPSVETLGIVVDVDNSPSYSSTFTVIQGRVLRSLFWMNSLISGLGSLKSC